MTKRVKLIPKWIKAAIHKTGGLFSYKNYDSSAYWKKRASQPGQAAVLWKNQEYNELYRHDQREVITSVLSGVSHGSNVLDIGCGIGIVAKMIVDIRTDITVDAVDFPEMITVAKKQNDDHRINYISSSAENYCPEDEHYDLIISSACYSAIRNIRSLESALDNAAQMCRDGGSILMIDPYHRWNYLARAKYNSNDVIRHMRSHGFSLTLKSGLLFWPYRERLANSKLSGKALEKRYRQGEHIRSFLGSHFWADYKILCFQRR